MRIEELQIREELELDVEKGLEEEIKQGIYRLALKLHRLYQHQKERTCKQSSSSSSSSSSSDHQTNKQGNMINARKKFLSELNINIKMEGGAVIQIKEIKKENDRLAPSPKHAQNVLRGKTRTPRTMKFDWVQSLRSNVVKANHKTRDKEPRKC